MSAGSFHEQRLVIEPIAGCANQEWNDMPCFPRIAGGGGVGGGGLPSF